MDDISILHYPYISCIPRWTPFQLVGGLPLALLRCCSGGRRLDAQREGAPMPDVLKLAQRLGKSWIYIYIYIFILCIYIYIFILYIYISYIHVCVYRCEYLYIYICIIMYVIISFKYHMIMYVHVLYTTVLIDIRESQALFHVGELFWFSIPKGWRLLMLRSCFPGSWLSGWWWKSMKISKKIEKHCPPTFSIFGNDSAVIKGWWVVSHFMWFQ